MSGENQRRSERWISACPASFEVAAQERVGFVRDLSERGALVFTEQPAPPGAAVTLAVHVGKHAEPVRARGRVVRSVRRDRACSYPWRFSVAVEFDVALDGPGALRTVAPRSVSAVGPA